MSWQTQIIQQLTTIQNWITNVNTNKKQINELDEVTSTSPTDEIGIDQGAGVKKVKINNVTMTKMGDWYWIEGSWVEKGTGNTNLTLIEAGDTVIYKLIDNNSDPVILVRHEYISGDKELLDSYEITLPLIT